VKLGTSVDEDVARIAAIREAVGSAMPLRIDANQGWDAATAIKALKALEPYGIDHCEEPVPRWDARGLLRVAAHSPIPIMAISDNADLDEVERAYAAGANDYLVIPYDPSMLEEKLEKLLDRVGQVG